MNQYLINTKNNSIVGRFATIADAEIAGEMLLGTDPFDVHDEETLAAPKSVYTKAILRDLLRNVAGGEMHPKATRDEILSKLLDVAGQFHFAPIEALKPVAPEKAPRDPSAPASRPGADTVCGQAWAIYDGLTLGNSRKDAIAAAVAQGINPATASTQYQRWTKRS